MNEFVIVIQENQRVQDKIKDTLNRYRRLPLK